MKCHNYSNFSEYSLLIHRGIDKETKEWIYGNAVIIDDHIYLATSCLQNFTSLDQSENTFEVKTCLHDIMDNSFSIYTGMMDIHGEKIFTNHILNVRHKKSLDMINSVTYCKRYKVEFHIENGFRLVNGYTSIHLTQQMIHNHDIEIVGDIFNNKLDEE